MADMTENQEAGLVLAGKVMTAVTTFVATIPIPLEWKVPIASLVGAVDVAIFAFWKAKVNKIAK